MVNVTVLGSGAGTEPLGKQPGGLFVGDAERRRPRGNVIVPRVEVR